MNPYLYMIYICVRRKLWLPKGIRPIVTLTGSHQRTCVFGTLTREGNQLFRQYEVFNQDTFLDYLGTNKEKTRKEGYHVYR